MFPSEVKMKLNRERGTQGNCELKLCPFYCACEGRVVKLNPYNYLWPFLLYKIYEIILNITLDNDLVIPSD